MSDHDHTEVDLSQSDKSSRDSLRIRLLAKAYRWMGPLLGLAALAWFLIRVIPKPSRASYPCQRAAFPIASAFVIWLTGCVSAAAAYRRARISLAKAQYKLAVVLTTVAIACGWAAFVNMPTEESQAYEYVMQTHTANQPMGVAQGIYPGRVVWIRDAEATDWNGTSGLWSDAGNTDQAVVDDMVSRSIRYLTGELTDADAWDALFRYRNIKRGKGDVGYQSGEKIAIKINLTLTNADSNGADEDGYHVKNTQYVGPSFEMVKSLLLQLVQQAGVPADKIYIGDPTCVFPTQLVNYLTAAGLGDVNFMTNLRIDLPDDDLPGRTTVQFSDHELNWSTSSASGLEQDYVPQYYAEAEYFINFAIHKAHGAAVTLCGKNHYGSLIRRPPTEGYYNMHDSLPLSGDLPNMRVRYRALVDLMGHEDTGGKTLIYILDGLWTGYGWGGITPPFKWRSAPCNNDWLSSILVSQDPVAIDSVGYDMWFREGIVSWNYFPFTYPDKPSRDHYPQLAGGDDYLHEAAKAYGADSGTAYDPEQDGSILASLGVHEHWNNPTDRKYSRNLGTGDGIELITEDYTPVVGRYVFYNHSAFDQASDDDAIATDKQALLPGETALPTNYTSYSKGINGIMIDIQSLASSTLAATEFTFKAGNTADPSSWADAPTPTVTVRKGEGVNGSDRVVLTWPDGAISKQWLEVTLLSSAVTGVLDAERFYFGNAIGDTCDQLGNAIVDATDQINCRNNPRHFMRPAGIDCPYDHNRDQKVDATDEIIARENTTDFSDALIMLSP